MTLLCIVAGVMLFWHAQSAKRREQSAYLKQLTLGYLLDKPSISIQTIDPVKPRFSKKISASGSPS